MEAVQAKMSVLLKGDLEARKKFVCSVRDKAYGCIIGDLVALFRFGVGKL